MAQSCLFRPCIPGQLSLKNPGYFVFWRKTPKQWRNLPGRASHRLATRSSGLGHSFPEFGCAVLRGGCDDKKHIRRASRSVAYFHSIAPPQCSAGTGARRWTKKEGLLVGQPRSGTIRIVRAERSDNTKHPKETSLFQFQNKLGTAGGSPLRSLVRGPESGLTGRHLKPIVSESRWLHSESPVQATTEQMKGRIVEADSQYAGIARPQQRHRRNVKVLIAKIDVQILNLCSHILCQSKFGACSRVHPTEVRE